MAWDVRPPEWVLEEMYKTGRRWMSARAHERAHGPSGIDATAGDNPPTYEEPAEEDRAAHEAHQLQSRFQQLFQEFVDSVERL